MSVSNSAEQFEKEPWHTYLSELQKESPRGKALVGAAMLDERLRELLEKFLVDKSKAVDKVLGSDRGSPAPLSTFSARIKAAYCLGLLAQDQYQNLETVRKIRNKFAHRLECTSFSNKKVQKLCTKLTFAEELETRLSLPPKPAPNIFKFQVLVVVLAYELDSTRAVICQERRTVPKKEDIPRWKFTRRSQGQSK